VSICQPSSCTGLINRECSSHSGRISPCDSRIRLPWWKDFPSLAIFAFGCTVVRGKVAVLRSKPGFTRVFPDLPVTFRGLWWKDFPSLYRPTKAMVEEIPPGSGFRSGLWWKDFPCRAELPCSSGQKAMAIGRDADHFPSGWRTTDRFAKDGGRISPRDGRDRPLRWMDSPPLTPFSRCYGGRISP
jgi:hypothetical protein